jgi:hypothetical protein
VQLPAARAPRARRFLTGVAAESRLPPTLSLQLALEPERRPSSDDGAL